MGRITLPRKVTLKVTITPFKHRQDGFYYACSIDRKRERTGVFFAVLDILGLAADNATQCYPYKDGYTYQWSVDEFTLGKAMGREERCRQYSLPYKR